MQPSYGYDSLEIVLQWAVYILTRLTNQQPWQCKKQVHSQHTLRFNTSAELGHENQRCHEFRNWLIRRFPGNHPFIEVQARLRYVMYKPLDLWNLSQRKLHLRLFRWFQALYNLLWEYFSCYLLSICYENKQHTSKIIVHQQPFCFYREVVLYTRCHKWHCALSAYCYLSCHIGYSNRWLTTTFIHYIFPRR